MAKKIESQLGRDYFWNTASSIIGSASMVLMLLVVTRLAGAYAAGIFSLATAIGQQFQTVGAYEVRPYQATDVRHRFSFGTYYATRLITITFMLVGIIVYALVTNHSATEAVVIILVASLRLFDAFEDVFYGEFQRLGRLDIAGKANFFRVSVTLVSFAGAVAITRDLAISTALTIGLSLIAMIVLIYPAARKMFALRPAFSFEPIKQVLMVCLPLALAAFMAMYLANAPRFAVENHLDAESLGYYATLFLPALAINILVMFIFRPLLTRMAIRWTSGDYAGFMKLVVRGLQSVFAAFILTFVVCFFVGIPILNLLSGFDLDDYRVELLVLVAGGAFNAVGIIFYYALTTMRRQGVVFVGYVVAATVAAILSNVFVLRYGMLGAAVAYLVAMAVLALIFFAAMTHFVRHKHASVRT